MLSKVSHSGGGHSLTSFREGPRNQSEGIVIVSLHDIFRIREIYNGNWSMGIGIRFTVHRIIAYSNEL